jgi:diguanylate cyclase
VDAVTATAALAATPAALAVALAVAGAFRMQRRARRAEDEAAALRYELINERRAASHDPLTDVLNRRAFFRQAIEVVGDPARHPLVAVVLDLDDFKQINDNLGHAAGDDVLATVARRFADYAEGSLVARLGGDEFAGLFSLPTTDTRWLHRLAAQLTAVLSLPVKVGDHRVTVSASVGLAPVRGLEMAHLAEALRAADHDMFGAKAARRDAYRGLGPEPTHRAIHASPQILGSASPQVTRSMVRARWRPEPMSRHRVPIRRHNDAERR